MLSPIVFRSLVFLSPKMRSRASRFFSSRGETKENRLRFKTRLFFDRVQASFLLPRNVKKKEKNGVTVRFLLRPKNLIISAPFRRETSIHSLGRVQVSGHCSRFGHSSFSFSPSPLFCPNRRRSRQFGQFPKKRSSFLLIGGQDFLLSTFCSFPFFALCSSRPMPKEAEKEKERGRRVGHKDSWKSISHKSTDRREGTN